MGENEKINDLIKELKIIESTKTFSSIYPKLDDGLYEEVNLAIDKLILMYPEYTSIIATKILLNYLTIKEVIEFLEFFDKLVRKLGPDIVNEMLDKLNFSELEKENLKKELETISNYDYE